MSVEAGSGGQLGQGRLGIDAVELGGLDQDVDEGGALAAAIGTGEQRCLPRPRPSGSADRVLVHDAGVEPQLRRVLVLPRVFVCPDAADRLDRTAAKADRDIGIVVIAHVLHGGAAATAALATAANRGCRGAHLFAEAAIQMTLPPSRALSNAFGMTAP